MRAWEVKLVGSRSKLQSAQMLISSCFLSGINTWGGKLKHRLHSLAYLAIDQFGSWDLTALSRALIVGSILDLIPWWQNMQICQVHTFNLLSIFWTAVSVTDIRLEPFFFSSTTNIQISKSSDVYLCCTLLLLSLLQSALEELCLDQSCK